MYYVYITTNPNRSTIYVGFTNDLCQRLEDHYKSRGNWKHFASKYYCYNLIYYETYERSINAIAREKEIKKWRRAKKNRLIDTMNPRWKFIKPEEIEV